MGLLSDAGVHSHIKNLFNFLKIAKKYKIKNCYIHAFLDGRDTPPKSATKYLSLLEKFIKKINYGKIASIHGRFYAMDRGKNWNRTKKTYKVLTQKQKVTYKNWQDALKNNYLKYVQFLFFL